MKDRESRLPLFVPVQTTPSLRACWSVNLSASGMGLEAALDPHSQPPTEGALLTVRFVLPGSVSAVVADAQVMWLHDAPERVTWLPHSTAPSNSVAMGLAFKRVDAAHRRELRRYLDTYRFQVATVYAPADERSGLEASLAQQCQLIHADDADEALAQAERGDLAALLVFGAQQGAIEVVQRVSGGLGAHAERLPQATFAADRAPRIIYCAATADATALLPLFNAGRLFRALPQPLVMADLQRAVEDACRDYAVRAEQRRVALGLERALSRLRAQQPASAAVDSEHRPALVYDGEPMTSVLRELRRVAPHDVPVLLQGESGTGKEALAHLLHESSPRREAPFFIQDCGTLVESLLESELFGHVKGAFTGAVANHHGVFAEADGGTVFLDDIQNMSLRLQAKLLRVLDTGEIRPVGASRLQRVDVRIVAASNADLAALADAGKLRADLYYRLSAFPLDVPPLRQRPRDVRALARYFLQRARERLGRRVDDLSRETLAALEAYPWPGNVRQLQHVIERAVLLCDGPEIRLQHLLLRPGPQGVQPRSTAVPLPPSGIALREALAQTESAYIQQALAASGGVVDRAAKLLHMHPVTLGRRIQRYGLKAVR